MKMLLASSALFAAAALLGSAAQADTRVVSPAQAASNAGQCEVVVGRFLLQDDGTLVSTDKSLTVSGTSASGGDLKSLAAGKIMVAGMVSKDSDGKASIAANQIVAAGSDQPAACTG